MMRLSRDFKKWALGFVKKHDIRSFSELIAVSLKLRTIRLIILFAVLTIALLWLIDTPLCLPFLFKCHYVPEAAAFFLGGYGLRSITRNALPILVLVAWICIFGFISNISTRSFVEIGIVDSYFVISTVIGSKMRK